MILKLYNSLDTRSKRCLYFDIFTLIFIFGPKKYLITRKGIMIILSSFLFVIGIIKGDDKLDNIKNINYIQRIDNKKPSVI